MDRRKQVKQPKSTEVLKPSKMSVDVLQDLGIYGVIRPHKAELHSLSDPVKVSGTCGSDSPTSEQAIKILNGVAWFTRVEDYLLIPRSIIAFHSFPIPKLSPSPFVAVV